MLAGGARRGAVRVESSAAARLNECPLSAPATMSAAGATATLRMLLARVLWFIENAEPRFPTDYPRFVLRLEQARLIQTSKEDFHLVAIEGHNP